MNCYEKISSLVAKRQCARLCNASIRQLRSIKEALLSGDDTPLANTWDEICVQCQSERSYHWDIYETTIQSILRPMIEDLPQHVQQAIWLQTQHGEDYVSDTDAQADPPCDTDDIADYVMEEYVLPAADSYSNERIRKYLGVW